MKKRNSISKALQQMRFEKGKGRYDNEVIDCEAREREYLTELCRERNIEVDIKGDKRDNLTLPEYKAAMRKVESLEAEAERLDQRNEDLEQNNETLQRQADELRGQAQEMESHNNELVLQAQELTKQIEEALSSLFGGEEYVKVKKSDWNKMLDAFSRAVSRNRLLEKYEKKIAVLENKVADFTEQVEKLKRFVASRGLGEAFVEFVKSLELKSMKQRIADAKAGAAEQNRQREMQRQGLAQKEKLRGQAI